MQEVPAVHEKGGKGKRAVYKGAVWWLYGCNDHETRRPRCWLPGGVAAVLVYPQLRQPAQFPCLPPDCVRSHRHQQHQKQVHYGSCSTASCVELNTYSCCIEAVAVQEMSYHSFDVRSLPSVRSAYTLPITHPTARPEETREAATVAILLF